MDQLRSRLKSRQVLLALVIAVEFLGLLPLITQVHVAEYDEAIFLDVANSIHTTDAPLRSLGADSIFFFDHTPLYIYFISPLVGSADTRLTIARWLTLIFAVGCVWLVFLCGEHLKNTLAGFVAALLTAVNSFFLIYSFFVRMEVLMAFLVVLSFYCLIRSEKTGDRVWCFLAGLALGGAVLTKEMALGLAVVYFVYIAFVSRWPDRVWRLVLSLGPSLIALSGWVLWAWAWSPADTQAALNRWFASAALTVADSRAQITTAQWTSQLGGDLLGWTVVALSLVSVYFCVKAARQGTRAALVPVLYVVVAVGFSYLVRLKELRHLIAVVPMMALLIGVGMSQLFDDLKMRQMRGAQIVLGALLVIAILDTSPLRFGIPDKADSAWLDPLYAFRLSENDRYYAALRSAGVYLSEHTQPGEILNVVHEATVTSLYADRHYNMLYVLPFEAIIETLSQAHYLVYDDHVFLQLNDSQIQAVEAYIHDHFSVAAEMTDNGRDVLIYQRTAAP